MIMMYINIITLRISVNSLVVNSVFINSIVGGVKYVGIYDFYNIWCKKIYFFYFNFLSKMRSQ